MAHFYMKKESKINDPVDFFNFNLLSKDNAWQIKGTTGHGIKYKGDGSPTPVLNCWLVDSAFIDGMKKYYADQNRYSKYKYTIIFSRKYLENKRLNIVDVQHYGGQKRYLRNCWHYDVAKRKYGSLRPFNYCKVVRVKIPLDRITKEPVLRLPPESIVGMMVQHGEKHIFAKALAQKSMKHVKLFSL